jgi:hypothetical protein
VALVALTVPLNLTTPIMSEMDEPAWVDVLLAVLVLAYTTVGAFVASRRPGNPIGWIFCGAGSLIKFGLFFRVYAGYALFAGAGNRRSVFGPAFSSACGSGSCLGYAIAHVAVPKWSTPIWSAAPRGKGAAP